MLCLLSFLPHELFPEKFLVLEVYLPVLFYLFICSATNALTSLAVGSSPPFPICVQVRIIRLFISGFSGKPPILYSPLHLRIVHIGIDFIFHSCILYAFLSLSELLSVVK